MDLLDITRKKSKERRPWNWFIADHGDRENRALSGYIWFRTILLHETDQHYFTEKSDSYIHYNVLIENMKH